LLGEGEVETSEKSGKNISRRAPKFNDNPGSQKKKENLRKQGRSLEKGKRKKASPLYQESSEQEKKEKKTTEKRRKKGGGKKSSHLAFDGKGKKGKAGPNTKSQEGGEEKGHHFTNLVCRAPGKKKETIS